MSDQSHPNVIAAAARMRACDLVVRVRDEHPDHVGKHLAGLHRRDLEALTIVLAAMVPDDRPVAQLLAWIETPNGKPQPVKPPKPRRLTARKLEPCGTRSAAARHRANSEPVDPACEAAERAYYADAKRERRARDRQLEQAS